MSEDGKVTKNFSICIWSFYRDMENSMFTCMAKLAIVIRRLVFVFYSSDLFICAERTLIENQCDVIFYMIYMKRIYSTAKIMHSFCRQKFQLKVQLIGNCT
ncbi:hypothetical protein DERF_005026 [Dermatophagoides farinae]|uniref:Uncharacterized protein n=1 Tax=Dermatophagoides farinae TaxID=6954 RepID=A0A922L6R6_DERFA|nr:hypothetical protein DERF_005026 [Dermatophagoides farinae]